MEEYSWIKINWNHSLIKWYLNQICAFSLSPSLPFSCLSPALRILFFTCPFCTCFAPVSSHISKQRNIFFFVLFFSLCFNSNQRREWFNSPPNTHTQCVCVCRSLYFFCSCDLPDGDGGVLASYIFNMLFCSSYFCCVVRPNVM